MKKVNIFLILCLISTITVINGCGGKYSDAKKATEEYADIMEEYINAIDKSNNASDVAKAINNFTDKIAKLAPKMAKLQEKYPELQTSNTPPKELAESQKRIEALSQKFSNSMMKMIGYMNDPEVKKAQERMNEIMQKMKI